MQHATLHFSDQSTSHQRWARLVLGLRPDAPRLVTQAATARIQGLDQLLSCDQDDTHSFTVVTGPAGSVMSLMSPMSPM